MALKLANRLNLDYFENIDSPAKAYKSNYGSAIQFVLGTIFACMVLIFCLRRGVITI